MFGVERQDICIIKLFALNNGGPKTIRRRENELRLLKNNQKPFDSRKAVPYLKITWPGWLDGACQTRLTAFFGLESLWVTALHSDIGFIPCAGRK